MDCCNMIVASFSCETQINWQLQPNPIKTKNHHQHQSPKPIHWPPPKAHTQPKATWSLSIDFTWSNNAVGWLGGSGELAIIGTTRWVESNNGICLVQPQLKGIEYMCFKGAMGSASELAQCGFNWVRREKEREKICEEKQFFFRC